MSMMHATSTVHVAMSAIVGWHALNDLPKNAEFLKKNLIFYFLPFVGPKVGFWSKKRCFGVFWTGCEVPDLKQRQKNAHE